MEKVAAEKLGEPVVAGVVVASKGHLLKMGVTAGVGGLVGAAAGAAVGARTERNTQLINDYKGLMYIGLGPTKLGIYGVKRGLLKNSITEMLLSVPRAEVASLEVGKGFTAPVTITLKDGTAYTMEVARAFKSKAEKLEKAFNAG